MPDLTGHQNQYHQRHDAMLGKVIGLLAIDNTDKDIFFLVGRSVNMGCLIIIIVFYGYDEENSATLI
ncbi:hypothetical protein [Budvicia aquatica]|uniref:hypothetical protein n=1 Tax=Budvicia aquatica TaxID=82979 RepID=UPI001B6E8FF9|nr:hypothetical protein [Budvicia aquatica]MBP9642608.1 hypothetical protein [Budvicia sp.]